MNYDITNSELAHQFNQNSETPLWSQKAYSLGSILKSPFVISMILFAVFYVFLSTTTDSMFDPVVSIILNAVVIVAVFAFFVRSFLISTSLKYTIYPKHISFEWGYFNKERVDIPIEDLTYVNLVEYNNSNKSTIYIGTKHTYDLHTFNIAEGDSRPQITLERVKNGKEIYNLLMKLKRI